MGPADFATGSPFLQLRLLLLLLLVLILVLILFIPGISGSFPRHPSLLLRFTTCA